MVVALCFFNLTHPPEEFLCMVVVLCFFNLTHPQRSSYAWLWFGVSLILHIPRGVPMHGYGRNARNATK